MSEKKVDAGWLIGEVLTIYPETLTVFQKHFGETCMDYPGATLETIELGSVMHSLDVEQILDEINECITSARAASE